MSNPMPNNDARKLTDEQEQAIKDRADEALKTFRRIGKMTQLASDVTLLLTALAEARERENWKDAEKSKPEVGKWVYGCGYWIDGKSWCQEVIWNGEAWQNDEGDSDEIFYWLPLPEPPLTPNPKRRRY